MYKQTNIEDIRLLYEAVYDEDLRILSDQYNNSLFFEDIPELALEYFYAIGLNDDGISILAETLGFDEFTDWIFDIEEQYILSEARRGPNGTRIRIEPVTTKGEPFKKTKANPKGIPQGKSLERLRKLKDKRRKNEESPSSSEVGSEDKPSGLTAALRSQAAISAASRQQNQSPQKQQNQSPQKKNQNTHVLDPLARIILRGIERDRAARERLRTSETGKLIRRIGIGAKKAERFAGKALDFGLDSAHRYFNDDFEMWVGDLVQEGYDLSEYTWDDVYEIYESILLDENHS
jgi:hypothetical protein